MGYDKHLKQLKLLLEVINFIDINKFLKWFREYPNIIFHYQALTSLIVISFIFNFMDNYPNVWEWFLNPIFKENSKGPGKIQSEGGI